MEACEILGWDAESFIQVFQLFPFGFRDEAGRTELEERFQRGGRLLTSRWGPDLWCTKRNTTWRLRTMWKLWRRWAMWCRWRNRRATGPRWRVPSLVSTAILVWTGERGEDRAYQGRGCTEACSLQSRPVMRQKVGSFEDMRRTHKWYGAFPRTVRNSEEI